MIFLTVGLVSEPPPLCWEDRGIAFRGLGHPGVTRALVPLCSCYLPGHITPGPRGCCCRLWDESCEETTPEVPPALTCFTQRVPDRVVGGRIWLGTSSWSGRWLSEPVSS